MAELTHPQDDAPGLPLEPPLVPPAQPDGPTERRYREQLSWDSVSKGTHLINCWYQRNCAFNVFVRDGVVVREPAAISSAKAGRPRRRLWFRA